MTQVKEVNWEGKTKGGIQGHKFFIFILKTFGLGFAYFFLRIVAFYYFLFDPNRKIVFNYFREIHGYSNSKARKAVYKNFYIFGQTLIDKVAMLSGLKENFTIDHEGHEHLQHVRDLKKGSILLSAHIGNWEIAGNLLKILDQKFNILMYDNEMEKMKNYMEEIQKKKSFKIIPIKDGDMSHLVELHKAFSDNEWVVMHGDRYRPGSPTIEKMFLGKKAKFPLGPFIMAAKFGVPVTIVFAVKESNTHYHFFAKKTIEVKRARTEVDVKATVAEISDRYVAAVEEMTRKYPEQWFNFYDFWA